MTMYRSELVQNIYGDDWEWIEVKDDTKENTYIEDTLAARAQNYGDYSEGCRVSQNILKAMQDSVGWERLTDDQKESLYMIGHKIRRIVNGNAEHYDSWHDIAGYAQLSANEVKKRQTRVQND